MKSRKAGSRIKKNKSKKLFGGSSNSLDNASRGVSFDDGKERKSLINSGEPKKSSPTSSKNTGRSKKSGENHWRLPLAVLVPIAGILIYAGATGQLSGKSNSNTKAYA